MVLNRVLRDGANGMLNLVSTSSDQSTLDWMSGLFFDEGHGWVKDSAVHSQHICCPLNNVLGLVSLDSGIPRSENF